MIMREFLENFKEEKGLRHFRGAALRFSYPYFSWHP
jgi:hypothetical protein